MFFPRRRWAVRLIEKMGLPIKSREATTLIELVIWASKQDQQMLEQSIGKSLPTAELVIMGAARMANNQSAIIRVADELAVSPVAAENALVRLSKAAREVAAENGYAKNCRDDRWPLPLTRKPSHTTQPCWDPMPSPKQYRKHGLSADRRRALQVLATSPDGCTEALMLAHSFTLALLVDLVRAGLATAQAERVIASKRAVEVTRVRITDTGRQAL